jgi:hypothetical protein
MGHHLLQAFGNGGAQALRGQAGGLNLPYQGIAIRPSGRTTNCPELAGSRHTLTEMTSSGPIT